MFKYKKCMRESFLDSIDVNVYRRKDIQKKQYN